jgi:uncharacterized protein (TIGR03085 family)
MTTPARAERRALCDLVLEVGPDAPTRSGEWTTADLAAHLVVREHDPIGGAGILVDQLAAYTDRAMQKARDRLGYEGLVAQIRKGPPLGPFRWFEDQMNLNEFFVHHEDVRRGDGDGEPRDADALADLDLALWANLGRAAKLMTRSIRDVPLVLDWPGRGAHTVRRGEPFVILSGRPSEITLYLNGRRAVARVDVAGPAGSVKKLNDAKLGV